MPTYAKFMKDPLTKKRILKEQGIVELEARCMAIIKKSLPQKSRDPGSFTLPVTIGYFTVGKALLYLGASINLKPPSMLKKIGDVEILPTRMTLQLPDRTIKYPHGIVEDLLVKVDKFYFRVDFVIMDIEEDVEVPLILGRPFMKTKNIMIDVDERKLKVRVQDEEVSFDVFEAMKHMIDQIDCFRMDTLDELYLENQMQIYVDDSLMKAIINNNKDLEVWEEKEIKECLKDLEKAKEVYKEVFHESELNKASPPRKIELKQLPSHMKYVFIEENGEKHIIIRNLLSEKQEQ